MSVEVLPGRDPLRRLGSLSLITGLLGLLAIIYVKVRFVQGNAEGFEWMFGVAFCLLFGAVAGSLIQGLPLNHRARIEALEERADGNRSSINS